MPNTTLLDGFADYAADFISFNYTCSWAAPQFAGVRPSSIASASHDVINSLWRISNSEAEFTVDPLSIDVGNEVDFSTSLYG